MLDRLPKRPRVVTFHTHSVDDAMDDILLIGRETGTEERAKVWVADLRARLDRVRENARGLPRPRVFCVEWFDPIYCSGHWVPEMVEYAGGRDELAQSGKDSRVVAWQRVLEYAPERLVGMPCGMKREQARRELPSLTSRPGWSGLPAVRDGHAWLADGPSFFNGGSPRLVDGVEILAEIIHPELFSGLADPNAFERM